MRTKKPYEMAVKRSVSMPGLMSDNADIRRRELQLSTFSDYVQHLIRKDTVRQIKEATENLLNR